MPPIELLPAIVAFKDADILDRQNDFAALVTGAARAG